MKRIFYVASILMLIITSCSSDSELKINSQSPVTGLLKDYIEIVDQPYIIEWEEDSGNEKPFINIKVKSIKSARYLEIPNGKLNAINVMLEFYDENGNPTVSSTFGIAPIDLVSFENFILTGSGEKVFKFRGWNVGKKDNFYEEQDWSKTTMFSIVTAWEYMQGHQLMSGLGEREVVKLKSNENEKLKEQKVVSQIQNINDNSEYLIGEWSGKMSGKNLKIVIESVEGNKIKGYNILGTNKRPLSGTFETYTGTREDNISANGFNLILKEPGDDKWDGVFTIDINESYPCTGVWKANNGEKTSEFTIEKK